MKTITYIASNEEGNLFFQNNFTYIASNTKDGLDINYAFQDKGTVKESISLPIYVFSNGLSGLEAISRYLVETVGLRYCQIADLLNRDDRTIWDAYNGAKQKPHENLHNSTSCVHVPLQIFNNRTLSILESLTVYLKEEANLRYCQISSLLNKDARTIWTAYHRAIKKRKNATFN